jgi:hypothetical protein
VCHCISETDLCITRLPPRTTDYSSHRRINNKTTMAIFSTQWRAKLLSG